MSASKCRHCGVRLEEYAVGQYIHVTRLHRCQDHNVPYGCEAHPQGTACPTRCLGSRQDVGS